MVSSTIQILALVCAIGMVHSAQPKGHSGYSRPPSAYGSMLAPEPRQYTPTLSGTPSASLYPMYSTSPYTSGYGAAPSSAQPSTTSGLWSALRIPSGRRSSLTSRLRSLVNAIFFRRETATPYQASDSSYSYSFRQPPYGFSSSGSYPASGYLGSGGSGYRPMSSYSSYHASASAPNAAWSSYKQWASAMNGPSYPYGASSYSSWPSSSSPYGYTSGLSSDIGSYGAYGSSSPVSGPIGSSGIGSDGRSPSEISSQVGSSGSVAGSLVPTSGTGSATGSSNGVGYQTAASSNYPSSSSYSQATYSSPGSQTTYQRSSVSSFKPIVGGSGSGVSSSSSSVSVSSSSSGSSSSGYGSRNTSA